MTEGLGNLGRVRLCVVGGTVYSHFFLFSSFISLSLLLQFFWATAIRGGIVKCPSSFWRNRSRDSGHGWLPLPIVIAMSTSGSEILFHAGGMEWECVQPTAGERTKVRISLTSYPGADF